MKVKMKFDLKAVKNFVVEHGEKLAFTAAAIVFLMFVYSAFRREVLEADKQPDQLKETAGRVQAHVQQSKFDAKEQGLAVVNYAGRAKRDPVDAGVFAVPKILNKPVKDTKSKRGEPAVLAIEELRVGSGFGTFALKSDDGPDASVRSSQPGGTTRRAGRRSADSEPAFSPPQGSKLVGRAWAVVTGLVPHRKQVLEYSRAFDEALGYDSGRDRPQYVGFVLQRAEINTDQPDQLDWKDVPSVDAFVAQWSGVVAEKVTDEFVESPLTAKLGPLASGPWDSSVVHPRITSIISEKREAATGGAAAPAAAGVRPQAADVIARAAKGNRQESRPPAAQASATAGSATPEVTEYRLCRFFDFDVDPLKKYRYRVKVSLKNPNYQVQLAILEKPEVAQQEFLETDWSTPSDTVAIPDRYGVLTGGVAKDSKSYDPAAEMVITAIDPKQGVEAATKVPVWRASIGNTIGQNVEAIDPRDGSILELEQMEFRTGIVVVDIHGGELLSRNRLSKLTAPVELLVMDPQGNLRMRNEFRDEALVEARITDAEEEDRGSTTAKGDTESTTEENLKRVRRQPGR